MDLVIGLLGGFTPPSHSEGCETAPLNKGEAHEWRRNTHIYRQSE